MQRMFFIFFLIYVVFFLDLCWSLDNIILKLPEVKKAEREVYAAYYDLKVLYSQFGINLDSYYRYSYNQPNINLRLGPNAIRISNDYSYNYGVQINWIIRTFGFFEHQAISKEIIYKSKILKYQHVISEMYLKLYQLLYEMFKAYNIYEFSNNSVSYTHELLANTKKLYDVGVVAKVDYLRALSLYQESFSKSLASYQNYILAMKNIYSFLCIDQGQSELTELVFIYNSYLDSNHVVELTDFKRNPEDLRVSQILYSNIVSLIYQNKSILAQNNPRLILSSQYNRQNPSGFSRDYNFNISLSLTWKIFDSQLSKNQSKVIEQQILSLYEDYKRNIYNLDNSQNSIKTKYEMDYNMYQSFLYNLDYRKEAFRLIKLKYQNGLATYLDYLDAQNNLLQTVLNLKSYKNELFMDYVNYSYLNDIDLKVEGVKKKLQTQKLEAAKLERKGNS
ncbi:MAG: TolC family protein [bacterium]|nr:TolC family protein [bacterium]